MNIQELYKLYQQHPCITTDSRECPANSIFLALKGASFNGNQFVVKALGQGCAYAIADDPETVEETLASLPAEEHEQLDGRIIYVADCQIGRAHV